MSLSPSFICSHVFTNSFNKSNKWKCSSCISWKQTRRLILTPFIFCIFSLVLNSVYSVLVCVHSKFTQSLSSHRNNFKYTWLKSLCFCQTSWSLADDDFFFLIINCVSVFVNRKEICTSGASYLMCPLCNTCKAWNMSEICTMAKVLNFKNIS